MSTNNPGNAARAAYDLAFQTSPIFLAGGLAAQVPGGVMPIPTLVGSLIDDIDSGLLPTVKFVPLPGATAISNTAGTYPFANRNVAANAIIRNPKNISLLMIAPVNSGGGYLLKTGLFTALQSTLEAHTAAGGTYHVLTPSYLYFDCLLLTMTDVTGGEGHQQQTQWQLDFSQPLITQQAAQTAYNAMLSKISNGQPVTSSVPSVVARTSGVAAQGAASQIGVFPGLGTGLANIT